MNPPTWTIARQAASCPSIVKAAVFACAAVARAGAAESPEAAIRFNRDVLPILADHCHACHGPDKAARKAGLRLDRREAALAELESGARAIVPGDAAQSELWKRITSEDRDEVMPPPKKGKPLTPQQTDILRRWIEAGAAYEKHWAFISPVRVEPPVVSRSVISKSVISNPSRSAPSTGGLITDSLITDYSNPIDRFIRSRLAEEKIAPSPEADRATLIRRASLDLIGLPPSPLEVDAFVNDARPDAYERVVERLLASEHFGEKWARWWLDLAHYADSDGYLQDFLRPSAWRYRQWVVEALNRDLPFEQFTIEQLAGDLLPNATVAQRTATGFLRNTLSNREGGSDLEEYRVRQVVDRTVTVSTVWMGLTTGCAECHDHKFDPLTQREFYQLYAFFNDADEVNIDAPLPGEWKEHHDAKEQQDLKRAALLAPLAAPIAELQAAWEEKLLWEEAHPGADAKWSRALEVLGLVWGQGKGEGQLEGVMIVKTPRAARTPDQQDRLLDYFLKNGSLIAPDKFKELKLADLAAKLDALGKDVPVLTRAQAMTRSVAPRTTRVHTRGDFRRPGETVACATPAVLPALNAAGQTDRLALARWLVAPEHPLTARVTVNRLWQELFGRGLVATSDNFGARGQRPSHPELLDWLATEFPARGWSIKEMLRLMVTSETYGQSSKARPELAARDPNNALLARQTRLRLPAEAVRDAALVVSGLLNPTVGGPSVRPPQPESVSAEAFRNIWVPDKGAEQYRRGLYTFIQRLSPFAQFANFDMPSTSKACTQRERSNTPLQALNLLNDSAFVEAAQALAARVWRERRGDMAARIDQAFLLTLARSPTAEETARLTRYVAQQAQLFAQDGESARALAPEYLPGASASESAAWVALASVLLNLDEFINRE